jgi:ABC-type transport system involved in multi-copper enzyme maturation permease subunit
MRTLVKKEIRLLLPAFATALVLAILPACLFPPTYDGSQNPFVGYLFFFGTLMLAISSFGREIGLKTLPLLLAQPLERPRIWWTKFTVLALFVALAFGGWWLSGSLNSAFRRELLFPSQLLLISALIVAVFTTGGLCMTLLLRQVAAAFWLALLIPMAAIMGLEALGAADWMILTTLALYAVAAFFLARWQFLHLQDTAWTGGAITFGRRRAATELSSLRQRQPWPALLRKELQLQQVTFVGMACLLVLHLGVVAIRIDGAHTFTPTTLWTLEAFGMIWCVVPVLAGSQSVAEERKLGTLGASLCLPISRRIQWFLKLLVVFAIGLLSAALFSAVEHFAKTGPDLDVYLFFLLLALAGFYGSTLTSGVVQALAAAALTLLGLWLGIDVPLLQFDPRLWTGLLPLYIACPILVATLFCLSYRNFASVSESLPLWRRNALALGGMIALTYALTAAVYHRAWEWLTPLEPPHALSRLSLQNPPVLQTYGGRALAALLPDGRLWVDRLGPLPQWYFHLLPLGSKWVSVGGSEFVPGSNWVNVAVNSRETVAIRADGTLWVSAQPATSWNGDGLPPVENPAPLVQFGHDSDWQTVVRHPEEVVVLLKRDGTLWDWGTNSFNSQKPPSLLAFQPRQLGQDSDWARVMEVADDWRYTYAWKTDGTAWRFQLTLDTWIRWGAGPERFPAMDHTRWRSLVALNNFSFIGIRDDRTLWCSIAPAGPPSQIGNASDWAALSSFGSGLVARKTDGSLWKWDWHFPYVTGGPLALLRRPPVRLGTHSDWLAIGNINGGIASLAADGSLWLWPNPYPVGLFGDDSDLQLAASRKPRKIENIFPAHP